VALGWSDDDGAAERDRLVGWLATGEAGMRFSLPDDLDQVRGADLLYLTPAQVARHAAVLVDDYLPEAPALVAEVISPCESSARIHEKVSDYLAGGAYLVWCLYAQTRAVTVHRPDLPPYTIPPDGVLDGADVLPGFTVTLRNLFPW